MWNLIITARGYVVFVKLTGTSIATTAEAG
jgi:hypothetical protein